MTKTQLIVEHLKQRETLTTGERSIINLVDPAWVKENLFYIDFSDEYLNLAVYSEAEHDANQLKKEQGI